MRFFSVNNSAGADCFFSGHPVRARVCSVTSILTAPILYIDRHDAASCPPPLCRGGSIPVQRQNQPAVAVLLTRRTYNVKDERETGCQTCPVPPCLRASKRASDSVLEQNSRSRSDVSSLQCVVDACFGKKNFKVKSMEVVHECETEFGVFPVLLALLRYGKENFSWSMTSRITSMPIVRKL